MIKNEAATLASPSPLTGRANLADGPTPAKPPLADADETDCIPDTPDEGSASKAVHASVHAAGVGDQAIAGVQSTAALDAAKSVADPALVPNGVTPSVAAPSSHVTVSRARRMVPESPDEEGPPHVSSQRGPVSQAESCVPMPHHEAPLVNAPLVEQSASQLHSESLHLSLGMHSSGEARCKPVDQKQHPAQPPAQPAGKQPAATHQSASVMTATTTVTHGADVATGQAAVVPLSTEAGAAAQSLGHAVAATGNSSPADVSAVVPVQPACGEALPVGPASSRVAETMAGLPAPPALATAAMTHSEAVAAAEAAVTPANSCPPAAQVVTRAGMNTLSPTNDSALLAALDSAERKFMRVILLIVSGLLTLVKQQSTTVDQVLEIKRKTIM